MRHRISYEKTLREFATTEPDKNGGQGEMSLDLETLAKSGGIASKILVLQSRLHELDTNRHIEIDIKAPGGLTFQICNRDIRERIRELTIQDINLAIADLQRELTGSPKEPK